MITRFKNIRKGSGKEKAGDTSGDTSGESSESGKPPAKKSKVSSNEKPSEFISNDLGNEVSLSEAQYDEKVRALKDETHRRHRKSKIMGELIATTFPNRRKWILEQYPRICDILEKYPFLQLERWVCSQTLNVCMHACVYSLMMILGLRTYTCMGSIVYTSNT